VTIDHNALNRFALWMITLGLMTFGWVLLWLPDKDWARLAFTLAFIGWITIVHDLWWIFLRPKIAPVLRVGEHTDRERDQ